MIIKKNTNSSTNSKNISSPPSNGGNQDNLKGQGARNKGLRGKGKKKKKKKNNKKNNKNAQKTKFEGISQEK